MISKKNCKKKKLQKLEKKKLQEEKKLQKWRKKNLQEKIRKFKEGRINYTQELKLALQDAEKLGEEENLREGVRIGVEVLIENIRRGNDITCMAEETIKMFGLTEKKVLLEEALIENYKISLGKIIEKLGKNQIHTSDYRFQRDSWKYMAERVPELKEEFEKRLLAFRKRHDLVDYERIEEKVFKLAEKYGVSVVNWYQFKKAARAYRIPKEELQQKENVIVVNVICNSDLITRKIVEKHSKKITHHQYTPEDMNEPLEDYYYISFGADEDDLEKIFKEGREIRQEIEAAKIKLEEKICKDAGI